jgi:transcriptional regulator with GAF, ATPase, and Fis domain
MVECRLMPAGAPRYDEIFDALSTAGLHVRSGDATYDASPLVLLVANADTAADQIRRLRATGHERVLALMTDAPPANSAVPWELLDHGAGDVVAWQSDGTTAIVRARLERWAAVDQLLESPFIRHDLIGDSPMFRSVLRHVCEVASFTDANVLLVGESGTGKELVARAIHELDARQGKGDFVVVDCTTVVPTLSGSEFFGHERGAFTGAVATRDGAFALADGGTLFLDEVGELALPLQAELLRVVQEGTYKRVGSNVWQRARFRLICATNRDLEDEVAGARFRRDFYFRIAASIIRLPALRERPEDVLTLFEHFLEGSLGALPPIDPVVVDLLSARDYPGNIRDLRQLAVRVANRHVGPGSVTAGDVPEDERPHRSGVAPWSGDAFVADARRALALGYRLPEIREAAADAALRVALAAHGGHVSHAAHMLGVTDRAVQLRLAQWRRPSIAPTGAGRADDDAGEGRSSRPRVGHRFRSDPRVGARDEGSDGHHA